MDTIAAQRPISGGARRRFTARLIGGAARRALDDAGLGRVLAVFQRSFYLETASGRLACLGAEGLGAGPLNLLCDLPGEWDWQARGLGPGAPVRRRDDSVQIGERFAIVGSNATTASYISPFSTETIKLSPLLSATDNGVRPKLSVPSLSAPC